MQLVTRAQWGAPPTTPAAVMTSALGVKIHWIGGPYTTREHAQCAAKVREIRAEHLANKVNRWVDIAYNHLVCQHGYVFEGRGTGHESGANGNQPLNRAHYAVCAIVGTNETPTPELLGGLRDAIELHQAHGAQTEVLGHQDGYNTDCPGDVLEAWVRRGAPRPGSTSTPAPKPAPPAKSTRPPAPPYGAYDGHPLIDPTHSDRARMWQAYMAWRGWRIVVDGWYGEKSAAVCRAFQTECRDQGAGVGAIDGVVGPRTWAMTQNKPLT